MALQEWLEKRAAGIHVVLDLQNATVYYRSQGSRHRLGPLERRILLMLVNEPLSGADLAKKLGVWHQAVYKALKGLRRKGLVESWTGLGENLAGTRIPRRFHALNPGKVAIAVPVRSPTKRELQAAKEAQEAQGVERQREWIRQMRLLSPKPSTRLKALTAPIPRRRRLRFEPVQAPR
jgi:biotin operon repressor